MTRTIHPLDIRAVAVDHPEAVALTAEVQAVYARYYGLPDESPADPDEFRPPNGLFGIAYDVRGEPVATGGWRLLPDGRAELRRMYVREAVRRRGYAQRVITWLEDSARDAGATAMVLETGAPLPGAVELYRAAGYSDVAPFGYYADDPRSVFLGKPLTSHIADDASVSRT